MDLSNLAEIASEEIIKAKEKLLLERIFERTNVDPLFNLKDEAKKMFSRIKSNYSSLDQQEHWYWNDGSDNGLHLISFFFEKNYDNSYKEDSKISFDFKYC